MVQRNALIVAAAITAFVLVLVGGVAATLVQAAAAPAQTSAVAGPQAAAPSGAAQTAPTQAAPAPQPTQSYPVTADQAQSFALQAAPGGKLMRTPELVNFQGTPAYEVTLDLGKVYVDATTGAVLYNGATPAQDSGQAQAGSGPVTADQAAQIAQQYLGSGNVLGVRLAQDDGRSFFVVFFDNGTLVAVSADTGQIIAVRGANGGGGENNEGQENHG